MGWNSKKIGMIVVMVVFLSSTFYGAVVSNNSGGGGLITTRVGIDFGTGGGAQPQPYEVPNKSALWILNKSVTSLKIENGEVECISMKCEDRSKEWNFYVNYQEADKKPRNYYPKDQDVIVFRYENKSK